MALYKYPNYLQQTKNSSFDLPLQASAFVPCGGIYRCTGCGTEVALEGVGLLPDRDHHRHTPAQGAVAWQLVVATSSTVPTPYLHGDA